MNPRNAISIAAARAAGALSRTLTRGGATALPGVVGLTVDPSLIRRQAAKLGGTVVITGTNGKTTTARFVSQALRDAGHPVVHNQAGSNLLRGIAATLAQAKHVDSKAWGLFEVDEATMPGACRELQPDIVVVTNLFRDQLDRYGELKRTAEYIRQGLAELPESSTVVLNSDDPLVASLGLELRQQVRYYGIEAKTVGSKRLPHAADSLSDPDTGELLQYDRVYVGHLGHYRSSRWKRPKPDVAISAVTLQGATGSRLTLSGGLSVKLKLAVPGLYNAYNALAAATTGLALDIAPKVIAQSIAKTDAAFGRVERVTVEGKHLFIGLIKNPTGANEVIKTVALEKGKKSYLVLINDNFADGTDVSWLWDADFEELLPTTRSVTVGGTRAADMAVRLKYAGFDPRHLAVADSLPDAVRTALQAVPDGGTLYVLPTYTAMLALRKYLSTMGHVPHYLDT